MTSSFYNVDSALPTLARLLRTEGAEVGSRLGERTQELLHQQIILDAPWQREVLAPHRHVNIAAQIAETMWVLAGRNDVEFLSHYLPRAVDFSDDGKVWRGAYGPRLRAWGGWPSKTGGPGDQIKHIVDVLNADRTSRRAVVSIYDPKRDSAPGKDIPCNDFLSFISRDGFLHLSVFVRSNDLIWGWSGINAFEWSALQEIVAGLLGLNVGNLVFNTTSLHVYDRHWSKARDIEKSGKYTTLALEDSPRFDATTVINAPRVAVNGVAALDEVIRQWFDVEERLRNGDFLEGEADQIVEHFPEPMLRSWLRVLAWYWSGKEHFIAPLQGTRLYAATTEIPESILRKVYDRNHEHEFIGKPSACVCGELPPLEITITADTSGFKAAHDAVQAIIEKSTKDLYLVQGKIAAGSEVTITPVKAESTFVEYVDNLHREKSAAYGDSWKKRGELFSIIPNIARKIDRLEGGKSTADEVIADTAIDLLVYLVKYRIWLGEQHPQFALTWASGYLEENDRVLRMLQRLAAKTTLVPSASVMPSYVKSLTTYFEHLQSSVSGDPHGSKNPQDRVTYVDQMLTWSFILARHLWEQEADATSGYVNQDG